MYRWLCLVLLVALSNASANPPPRRRNADCQRNTVAGEVFRIGRQVNALSQAKANKGKKKKKDPQKSALKQRASAAQQAFSVKRALLGAERAYLSYLGIALGVGAGGLSLYFSPPTPALASHGAWIAATSIPIALFGTWRYLHYRSFFLRAGGAAELPDGFDARKEL